MDGTPVHEEESDGVSMLRSSDALQASSKPGIQNRSTHAVSSALPRFLMERHKSIADKVVASNKKTRATARNGIVIGVLVVVFAVLVSLATSLAVILSRPTHVSGSSLMTAEGAVVMTSSAEMTVGGKETSTTVLGLTDKDGHALSAVQSVYYDDTALTPDESDDQLNALERLTFEVDTGRNFANVTVQILGWARYYRTVGLTQEEREELLVALDSSNTTVQAFNLSAAEDDEDEDEDEGPPALPVEICLFTSRGDIFVTATGLEVEPTSPILALYPHMNAAVDSPGVDVAALLGMDEDDEGASTYDALSSFAGAGPSAADRRHRELMVAGMGKGAAADSSDSILPNGRRQLRRRRNRRRERRQKRRAAKSNALTLKKEKCFGKLTCDNRKGTWIDVTVPADVAALPSMRLGINAVTGRYCPCLPSMAKCPNGPFDATQDLVELHPSFARAHDAHWDDKAAWEKHSPYGELAFDWNALFKPGHQYFEPGNQWMETGAPLATFWSLDPDDLSHYDWAYCDKWFGAWKSFPGGAMDVLLRVGTSYNSAKWTSNFQTKAQGEFIGKIHVNSVKHVLAKYGSHVMGVEVLNEVDGLRFWEGSLEALNACVTTTFRGIQGIRPNLPIGVAGWAKGIDYDWDKHYGGRREGLYGNSAAGIGPTDTAKMLKRSGITPTMYSYHSYKGGDRNLNGKVKRYFEDSKETARDVFPSIPLWVTEFYVGVPSNNDWGKHGSGSTVAFGAKIAQYGIMLAKSGVSVAALYPLCTSQDADWGLLATSWDDSRLVWRPSAFAYRLSTMFFRETPHIWPVEVEGFRNLLDGRKWEFSAMGGSSANRRKVGFLFTAAQTDSSLVEPFKKNVKVRLSGLEKSSCYTQQIWRMTESTYKPEYGHNAIESLGVTRRCTGGYNMLTAQTINMPPVGVLYVLLTKE